MIINIIMIQTLWSRPQSWEFHWRQAPACSPLKEQNYSTDNHKQTIFLLSIYFILFPDCQNIFGFAMLPFLFCHRLSLTVQYSMRFLLILSSVDFNSFSFDLSPSLWFSFSSQACRNRWTSRSARMGLIWRRWWLWHFCHHEHHPRDSDHDHDCDCDHDPNHQ